MTASTETPYVVCMPKPMGAQRRLSASSNVSTTISLAVLSIKKPADWFIVRSRVHQGCVLSPKLFMVAIDWIMHKTTGNKRRGIKWTLTSLLEDLDFADNVALASLLEINYTEKHQTSHYLPTNWA